MVVVPEEGHELRRWCAQEKYDTWEKVYMDNVVNKRITNDGHATNERTYERTYERTIKT